MYVYIYVYMYIYVYIYVYVYVYVYVYRSYYVISIVFPWDFPRNLAGCVHQWLSALSSRGLSTVQRLCRAAPARPVLPGELRGLCGKIAILEREMRI